MCHIFCPYYYETANSFMYPLLSSYQSAMSVSGKQRCLFDKCGFLLKQYCGHKRTKIVFYRIAGGVYWSAVALTNSLVTITDPRCSLLIRDVVYLSVVSLTNLRVSITDPRKINENGQNRP